MAMSSVINLLKEEIAATGIISFARFMELALYAPKCGYYERDLGQIGKSGDFYTSVSVGPFFGELLAFQFARWLELLPKEAPIHLVESGAHNGQLAADVLAGLRKHAPSLLPQLEYLIVEPSEFRREAQESILKGEQNVRWRDRLPEPQSVRGIIFSNELLDALPVHQFSWSAATRKWYELGVTLNGDHLLLAPMPIGTVTSPTLPEELLEVLPDGYIIESSSSAQQWWKDAAASLQSGKLMTIDYGGTWEELLNPGREHGTVRSYSRHHVSRSPLDSPGEQDITAHVDFTAIRLAGEAAGLKTMEFTTQSQFLSRIARELWSQTGSWPHGTVRQFQTLTHPEHLGRPFRVLAQQR